MNVRGVILLALLPVGIAAGCGDDGTDGFALTAQPGHVSMFGEADVTLTGDMSRLGEVQSITIDGIDVLDARPAPSGFTVRVQGAPHWGAAHVVISGTKGAGRSDVALSFDAPEGGAAPVWAAFGASLTQGFQSGGLDAHGQTMGFAAQVVRAAGAFLAPPLVVDGFLRPLEPSAFIGNCNATWDVGSISTALLATLTDSSGRIDLRLARQDPTLSTRNFAVGGATVADIIQPAAGPPRVIERITEQPDGDPHAFAAPSALSQMARLVKLDPDVAVSCDLLANDSDPAVTASDDLHPEMFTDVGTIQQELVTLAGALGALHGDYFIGNLLDLTALPNVSDLRMQRLAAGLDTPQSFDAKVAQIDALVDAYNAALSSAVAPYPNLHIVDLKTPTTGVVQTGVQVGTVVLTNKKFGGLLSLDHVHFTDTGYALLANIFIDAINRTKGWHIPPIDLAAVMKNDPLSPANLHAAGVFCDSP